MEMRLSVRLPLIRTASLLLEQPDLRAQPKIHIASSLDTGIRKARKKNLRLLGKVWRILLVPPLVVTILIRLLDI
jgi:hypothetical protein